MGLSQFLVEAISIVIGGLLALHLLVRFDFFVPHTIRLTGELPLLRSQVKLKRLLAGGTILLLWLAAFSLLILFLVLDVSAGSPIVRIEWMRVLPGGTIVIMLTMFAAAGSVIANRVITYKKAHKETLQFMTVQAQLQKGNLEQAIRIAEGFPNSHLASLASRVMALPSRAAAFRLGAISLILEPSIKTSPCARLPIFASMETTVPPLMSIRRPGTRIGLFQAIQDLRVLILFGGCECRC